MEQFLIQYGLLGVLFCALIENDVTFILTGVIIHLRIVDPVLGLIYAVAGALGHDLLWFWLGHSRAESIRQSGVYRRVGPLVERLAGRFGAGELFFCRFVWGTRNPSLVFWGVQRLPLMKFLAIDAIALALWGGVLTGIGYFLSEGAAVVVGKVKSLEHLLFGVAVVAIVVVFGMRAFTRHEIRKRLRREAGEAEEA
jgi:membrane protein DedA with SNARE-associated domain